MRIAVLEDEQDSLEILIKKVEDWKHRNPSAAMEICAYHHAEDLLDHWEEGRYFDLFFLDIQMKGMDGFELAEVIREKDPFVTLVFTSCLDSYILRGYEVGAFRYLKKPISYEEIAAVMDYVLLKKEQLWQPALLVKAGGVSVRIPFSEIRSISTYGRMIRISADTAVYNKYTAESFEKTAAKMPSVFFVRCHRGYIVNMMRVKKYTHNEIVLTDGEVIPIGRKYAKDTIERLNLFFIREVHL